METPGPDRDEARSLMQKLQALADRVVAQGPGEDARGTWTCYDCEDTSFVMVPCPGMAFSESGRRRECTVCTSAVPGSAPHVLARDCLSCDAGRSRIAGRWVSTVYRANDRGKRSTDDVAMGRFIAYLTELHPVAADKIRVSFDRILTREKGGTA